MLAEGALWMRIFGAVFWIGMILLGLLILGNFYHDPNPPY
jgi:hypothetical protein